MENLPGDDHQVEELDKVQSSNVHREFLVDDNHCPMVDL
jgi:hypothetical protein